MNLTVDKLNLMAIKHTEAKDYIKMNWKKFYVRQAKRLWDLNIRCIGYINSIRKGDDVTVNVQNYCKTLVTLKKIEEDGLKWRYRKYSF